jgi:ADP-L-glycero-D-manno-heptose 6-epimerase
MKILITGYKGFIGQNVFNYIKKKGCYQVTGWDYIPDTIPDTSGYDWCIHLGAISDTTCTDLDKILKQNYDFSIELFKSCEKTNTNVQYASSASVYGTTTHFTEDGPLFPQSPYAWSKYLIDRYVSQNHFNITIQGFRYFNVYGQMESDKGNQASPYTKFTKQAKENKVITLFEQSQDYKRDFVCVDDLCKVHELMLVLSTRSGIFNVGTGKAVSFETVGRAIAKKHNAEIQYIPIPENIKSQYQKYTCANLSKLESIINIDWISIEDYIKAN